MYTEAASSTSTGAFRHWLRCRDKVDEITGSRAIAAASKPRRIDDTIFQRLDAELVPDTPPEGPSPALASLTPSAMALLQPAVRHPGALQQQRHVYAPPNLFPGFATLEKLLPQPSASGETQSQVQAPGNQHALYHEEQRSSGDMHCHMSNSSQEKPGCIRPASGPNGPACMHAPSGGSEVTKSRSSSHNQARHYSTLAQNGPAYALPTSPMQNSRGGISHSIASHRAPVQSPSRHSRGQGSLHSNNISVKSRAQSLSDTACQEQQSLQRSPGASAARQGSDADSGQRLPNSRGSKAGSFAQARSLPGVLQPRAAHNGPSDDMGRTQLPPWAQVRPCRHPTHDTITEKRCRCAGIRIA